MSMWKSIALATLDACAREAEPSVRGHKIMEPNTSASVRIHMIEEDRPPVEVAMRLSIWYAVRDVYSPGDG